MSFSMGGARGEGRLSRAVNPGVLADLLPRTGAVDVALVGSGALVIAVLAQVAIPLPFTPVPVSLATFAVLLVGGVLGPRRGGASALVYLIAGALGAPVFAGFSSGWSSASFGYIVGYAAAAALVGALARRRADRGVPGAFGAAALGSVAVYAFGVPWLMAVLHVGLAQALALGVYPFLIGDACKSLACALLFPGAWRLVRRIR